VRRLPEPRAQPEPGTAARALDKVAAFAGAHEVIPDIAATLGYRKHVICVFGGPAAVAASVIDDGAPIVHGERLVECVEPFTRKLGAATFPRGPDLRVGLLILASVFSQVVPIGLVVDPLGVGLAHALPFRDGSAVTATR